MSLMNMVSSNINQWTMLTAMLPIVYSVSLGTIAPIAFDPRQQAELWLTLGQAFIGVIFLINMELMWWEAVTLAVLFVIPFTHSAAAGFVTWIYFGWIVLEIVRMMTGHRKPKAFRAFAHVWKTHVKAESVSRDR